MTVKKQHWWSVVKGFAVGIIVAVLPFVITYLSTNTGTFEKSGLYTAIAAGFSTWLFSFLRTKNETKVVTETTTTETPINETDA